MEVLFDSFHLNGHTLGSHPQTLQVSQLAQQNNQSQKNVLLNSFHLNGHILAGLIDRLKTLEPPRTA